MAPSSVKTIFLLLADLTVMVHFCFIVFVVLGGFLALKRRSAWRYHLPALAWGLVMEFSGWICPLTPLENWFRRKGAETGYGAGFMEHYLMPVIYPANLTRQTQFLLGAALLIVNLAVYGRVMQNHFKRNDLARRRRGAEDDRKRNRNL